MRPIIGIPLRYQKLSDDRPILYMAERLRRTIQLAGGFIYPICPVQNVDYINTRGNEFNPLTDEEKELINSSLNCCDGLLFPGGMKFTPYDRYLLEVAIEKKIPVLGICLGMQMMSCYNKDVVLEKNETSIDHNQETDDGFTHKVKIFKDSKLYNILGKEEILVNSFHKMHVTENDVYKITAVSEDGLIEGIEYPGDFFNIGIQWHPEISYEVDEDSKKIIDAFIEVARENSKKNENNRESVLL